MYDLVDNNYGIKFKNVAKKSLCNSKIALLDNSKWDDTIEKHFNVLLLGMPLVLHTHVVAPGQPWELKILSDIDHTILNRKRKIYTLKKILN